MSLIFNESIVLDGNVKSAFNGVFLTQDSYVELLDLVDKYFHICLRDESCPLPCLTQSYMLISRQKERLKYALNKNVSLKIKSLFYNNKLELLVAIVYLKKNFTDNLCPHIIISKPEKINESYVNKLLNNEEELKDFTKYNNIIKLDEFYTVHGKVGIMINLNVNEPGEANVNTRPKTITDSIGRQVHVSNEEVSRPEVTLSVDNGLPPQDEESENTKDQPEMYMGMLVHKGKRGGKYVIKDNKKKYVSDAEIEGSKSTSDGVVYNVNLLAPACRTPTWLKS
jgi:hypothetical protein